jgi:ferredoxin-NADP reductase
MQGEAVTQLARQENEDSDASEKTFYDEEDRKSRNRLILDLLSKEQLQGTDIKTFKLARGEIEFKPGQFAFFKLDGVSADDSKGPVRHFTIASSPTEKDYLMVSTRIRDTPYKQKLDSLSVGAQITAWGPQGEFVLHDDHSKPAVLLSGGIGVTPFRSMIKYATDKQLPIKIVLFDSNKNKQNILYKDEFDKWAGLNRNVKIVYTVTEENAADPSWKGERSRIDRSMMQRHLSKDEIDAGIFYICGPPGMLKAMKKLLQEDMKIPKERLKIEAFTGY